MRTRDLLEKYLLFLMGLVLKRSRPRVIAVTGSVGKTTTASMITGMLKQLESANGDRLVVSNCDDHMNSTVGMPLTVLEQRGFLSRDWRGVMRAMKITGHALRKMVTGDGPAIMVLECGISRKGEMQRMASKLNPDIAIVTTVGPAHLERGLSSVEDVVREKSFLVRYARSDGLAIIGSDNPWAEDIAAVTDAKVAFSEGKGVELAENICQLVGRECGYSDAEVALALSEPKLPERRLTKVQSGQLTIIDDSFNASPLSMELALDTLAEEPCQGRRVAILGWMVQLGEHSEHFHSSVGHYARERADLVIGVGELTSAYEPDYYFKDSAECASSIQSLVEAGDCVLVKGARLADMNKVVQRLTSEESVRDCV